MSVWNKAVGMPVAAARAQGIPGNSYSVQASFDSQIMVILYTDSLDSKENQRYVIDTRTPLLQRTTETVTFHIS